MSTETKEVKTDLRSEYGLACPSCGHAHRFTIEITCSADLTIAGTEARGDHYWDDGSACFCDECGLNGTVAEFRVADGKAVSDRTAFERAAEAWAEEVAEEAQS